MATLHCKNCDNPMHDSRNTETYLKQSFVTQFESVHDLLHDDNYETFEVWRCENCNVMALCYGFDKVEWLKPIE